MSIKNNHHLELGKIGEDLACEYLIKKGYRIIERNHRQKYGEIDVVARDSDGTIVFVEVKTLRSTDAILPEDNMTKDKLRKLRKTCEAYANSHREFIKEKTGWRIDVIAIDANNLTGTQNNFVVRHYENI